MSSVLLIATAVIAFFILWWLLSWAMSLDGNGFFIKYSDFKQSYNTNPERWDLWYDHVRFIKQNKPYGKTVKFKFYPIGYCRYYFWKTLLENREYQAKQKAAYQEVMSIIKSDVQSSSRPSIEIDLKGKDKNKVIEKIVKYFKEDLGMEVKITDKETKDETSI